MYNFDFQAAFKCYSRYAFLGGHAEISARSVALLQHSDDDVQRAGGHRL